MEHIKGVTNRIQLFDAIQELAATANAVGEHAIAAGLFINAVAIQNNQETELAGHILSVEKNFLRQKRVPKLTTPSYNPFQGV